jgi:hypothetical protein
MEKTMSKAPKNKPMDDESAKENFMASAQFQIDLHSYMEAKGYKWCRTEHKYVDDGSLALEWADRKNDERRDKELEAKATL